MSTMLKAILWIIGILVLISSGVGAYQIGRIDRIDTDLQNYKMSTARDAVSLAKEQVSITALLPEKYVLKDDFKCTIEDLKKQLNKIADKQDDLLKEIRRK
jgi:hypothetical protein